MDFSNFNKTLLFAAFVLIINFFGFFLFYFFRVHLIIGYGSGFMLARDSPVSFSNDALAKYIS